MKKRTIITCILLLVTLVLTISVSYAWWSNGITDKEFSFTSAKVASTMRFYKGTDYDLDGVFDFETGFTDFQAEINDSSQDKFILLEINDFVPTEVYTYQMSVINNGDIDGYVVMVLNSSALENDLVRCFSMSLWDETNKKYEEKCFLGNLNNDNLIILGGRQSDKVEPNPNETDPVVRNFIFKLEFETEAALNEQGITISNYQALQNQTLSLHLFDFILSSVTYRS